MPGIRKLSLLSFFLSGFSALSYQVLWKRYLSLALGSTVYAISSVITVFMVGLVLEAYPCCFCLQYLWVEHSLCFQGYLNLCQRRGGCAWCSLLHQYRWWCVWCPHKGFFLIKYLGMNVTYAMTVLVSFISGMIIIP